MNLEDFNNIDLKNAGNLPLPVKAAETSNSAHCPGATAPTEPSVGPSTGGRVL